MSVKLSQMISEVAAISLFLFLLLTASRADDNNCTVQCVNSRNKTCEYECRREALSDSINEQPNPPAKSTTPTNMASAFAEDDDYKRTWNSEKSLLEYSHLLESRRVKRDDSETVTPNDCDHVTAMLDAGYPQLHLVEEGYDFSLVCDPCAETPPPDAEDSQLDLAENVTWYIRNLTSVVAAKKRSKTLRQFTKLVVDGEHFVKQPSGNLLLEEIKTINAAEYRCNVSGHVTSWHHVDVVKKEKRVLVLYQL